MIFDNDITRRSFLKGTAALFCAPAIVKAENIMKIWTPPEKQIVTEVGFDALNLQINGLRKGDQIIVRDEVTGAKRTAVSQWHRWGMIVEPTSQGHLLTVGVYRDGGFKHIQRTTVHPGGTTKIKSIGILGDR